MRIRLRGESFKLSHRAGGFAALKYLRVESGSNAHISSPMKILPTSIQSKKIASRSGELMMLFEVRRCEECRIESAILYFI